MNSIAFTNATKLTAVISISATAATGPGNVTITNGDGSTATGTNVFTVNARPAITSINPASRSQGATNQAVVITGSGFTPGVTVAFSGGNTIQVTNTTLNSPTQITVTINVAANAVPGARNVTVTNVDAGTMTLNNGFTVTAGPTITNVQLVNKTGGIAGRIQQGDEIIVTFSSPMSVPSFCSTWTGATPLTGNDIVVNVNVGGGRFGGGTNTISLTTSTSCAAFNFGTIDLESNGYVSSDTTFGGATGNTSIGWNGTTHALTITLGAQASGAVTTNAGKTQPVYTASSAITDTGAGPLMNSPFMLANGIQF